VPLIYLSCAWVAGIFLGSRLNLPLALILIGLTPLPLLFLRKYRKPIILTSLCLTALLGGTFYYQSSQPTVDENHLQFYNDQGIVEIEGMVNRDPEVRDRTVRLHLSVTDIKSGEEWHEVSGTALLIAPTYSTYKYGDMLSAKGELESSYQPDDFDSVIYYPEIELTGSGAGFKPLEWVYSLRNRLSQTLAEVLPEPQASLAQGIILGIRGNIPSTVTEAFSRTGTAHLLAISGLHLSILALISLTIGKRLFGKRHYAYAWLTLATVWLYALITGMNPPVIRAAIMVSLFLTAELLGRQRSAITALAFAAAVMVGISPRILWDVSFQMSFLAMAGLIFVFPLIQSLGRKAVNATLGEEGVAASIAIVITDSLSVTLAAILAVWPVVAYHFGVVSLVAPLATLLILPALPAIIIIGALAGGIGIIALPVAQVTGWIAWLFLSYMLLVVNAFAAIPLSSIELGSVSPVLICIYYPALALLIWLTGNMQRLVKLMPGATSLTSRLPKKWAILPLLVIAILVWTATFTMPDNNLRVSFLDVGQGDAILIQKGNQQILIDGGPSPQAISLELGEQMPFWDRTIDLVILTHPSADHVTGLVEVLNRYEVRQVLYPDLDFQSGIYDEWLSLIEEKNIPCTLAQAGQQISLAGVVIEVLNPQTPPLAGTQSDIDNNGIVLHVSLNEVTFLLTADTMREAELELIARRANLSSTVLKVGHHGSSTSTTPQLLAVVNPRLAVISVGEDNPHGHPTDDIMERLAQALGEENIYRTDEDGTIVFTTDGDRLWVRVKR
jgi:competence protein ComEC